MKLSTSAFLITAGALLSGNVASDTPEQDQTITLVDDIKMTRVTEDRFQSYGGKVKYKGAESVLTVSGVDESGQLWKCQETTMYDKKSQPSSPVTVAWRKSSYKSDSADMEFQAVDCNKQSLPEVKVTP